MSVYNIVRKHKVLETNLKSEEITNFYPIFLVEDIYPTAGYARSVSVLACPTVVYARSISLLVYPTVVYASSDTGLAYPTVVYASSVSDLVYPTVVYTRSISLLAYPKTVYVHYWHTQLPCMQGSEPYVPNGCAP